MAAPPAKEQAPAAKKGISIGLVIGLLLAATGAGGGVAWLVVSKATSHANATNEHATETGESKVVVAKQPPTYISLDPAIIVNLADTDSVRYLQTNIQLMSRDSKAEASVTAVMPAIRDAILALLAQKNAADIRGKEARESLRKEILDITREVMESETGDPSIDGVYFTNFVLQ